MYRVMVKLVLWSPYCSQSLQAVLVSVLFVLALKKRLLAKELYLGDNTIGKEGAKYISEALPQTKLTDAWLAHMHYTCSIHIVQSFQFPPCWQ